MKRLLRVIAAIGVATLVIWLTGLDSPRHALRIVVPTAISLSLYYAFKERLERDPKEWLGITAILIAVAVASFFIGPRGVPYPIELGVTVFALLSLVDLIGVGIDRYRHRASA